MPDILNGEKKRMEKEDALACYAGKDRVVSFQDKDKELKEHGVPIFKVMTRMPDLDYLIDGVEGGELIVISGETKGGKSLLGQTLTMNFLKQDIKSLWFTFEMRAEQFFRRFPDLPVAYLPREHVPYNLKWIQERILESKLKYGTQVVFIDHLHFLFDMGSVHNTSLVIGDIVRKLKTICVNLNIVIVLICHMDKLGEKERPTARRIRDSSFLTQESDTTLVVERLPDNEKKGEFDRANLWVEYARRKGTLHMGVKLIKMKGYLQEVANEQTQGQ